MLNYCFLLIYGNKFDRVLKEQRRSARLGALKRNLLLVMFNSIVVAQWKARLQKLQW